MNLGYLASITQEKLDRSKVPAKYLQQKSVVIEGITVTQEPIDEVLLEVVLSFVLKDKDGFELLGVVSKPERIYSGRETKFRALLSNKFQMKSQLVYPKYR